MQRKSSKPQLRIRKTQATALKIHRIGIERLRETLNIVKRLKKKYIKNRDWMMAKQWEIKLKDESKKKIHRIT